MSSSKTQSASDESSPGRSDTSKTQEPIESSSKSPELVSNPNVENIVGQLDPLYLKTYGPQIQDLGNTLLQHTWFGFDLDDTLHEFRKASKTASHAVFQQISESSHIPIDELAATYTKITKQKTASAFTDGKSSDYYRQERFRALLEAHSIEINDDHVANLAVMYKGSLAGALVAKSGVLSLLSYLRSVGKKVAIITEGPQDAQEWTLQHLGLTEDVLPARKEGIMTIYLSEGEDVLRGKEIKVDSLLKIEHILRLRGDNNG